MYNGCLHHDQVIEFMCSVREFSTAQRAGKICAVHWWLDGNDLDANLAFQDVHDFVVVAVCLLVARAAASVYTEALAARVCAEALAARAVANLRLVALAARV